MNRPISSRGHVYIYAPWEERDEDCIKIWHDIICVPSNKIVSVDWSPYEYMTEEQVKLWLDLGMPDRIGTGPLNDEDLQMLRQIHMY